jgi:hypothetical protein
MGEAATLFAVGDRKGIRGFGEHPAHVVRRQHQRDRAAGDAQPQRARAVPLAQALQEADGAAVGVQLLGQRDHRWPAQQHAAAHEGDDHGGDGPHGVESRRARQTHLHL